MDANYIVKNVELTNGIFSKELDRRRGNAGCVFPELNPNFSYSENEKKV